MLEANEEGHRKRFCAVGLSGGELFLACLGFFIGGGGGGGAEMQKVMKIAEIHFWPKKINTKKMVQK